MVRREQGVAKKEGTAARIERKYSISWCRQQEGLQKMTARVEENFSASKSKLI
jgi:hypothetical protein